MRPWIAFCRTAVPEQSDLWDAIESLNFDSEIARLGDWVSSLLTAEPPSSEINALWFGLHNPTNDDGEDSCQFYCAGSAKFSPEEPYSDWHCNPEYWPDGRYAESAVLHTIYQKVDSLPGELSYLGECFLCHGYLATLLSGWCNGTPAELLIGGSRQRAIAMGHDSGDIYFILQPVA
jgi:hypothetical protein